MTLRDALTAALAAGPCTAAQVTAAVLPAPGGDEIVRWHLERLADAGRVVKEWANGEVRYRLVEGGQGPPRPPTYSG